MNKEEKGLNYCNKGLLTGILVFVLLLWGPIEPYGLIVRVAYLIIIPVIFWYLLNYTSYLFLIDSSTNEAITRIIFSIIALSLFYYAFLRLNANYYLECTDETWTRDGKECIGDYASTKGPDYGGALVAAIFGIVAVWYVIVGHEKNK
jgi:hypothetical protein